MKFLINRLDRAIRAWNHRRIDKMRALKLNIARMVFQPLGGFVKTPPGAPILVLRLDGKLGDGVTATGFLCELKKHFPDCKLIVVTSSGVEHIYTQLKAVDQVYTVSKGIRDTVKLYLQLRKQAYRMIINTSHILNPRTLFFASLLRSGQKITFANKHEKIFSDHIDIDFRSDHITERYRKILMLLGAGHTDLSYTLGASEAAQNETEAAIATLRSCSGHLIALNSFAGARLRNLNARTTASIVRKLLEYPEVKVISLANEGDHRVLNGWIDQTYNGRWLHFPHYAGLDMNIALLGHCDLMITPDTAWVHIAAALKKKLVAIYREEKNPHENNAIIWAPYGTECETIFAPAQLDNPDDINTVSTDDIVAATVRLLGLKK